ncbi:MAG TPA: metallopeptidase TldD-related protein [Planctomycetota bacterium]|nr:metallopeptidase TldD-related protein [Planctomycetota bacterium]
MSEHLLSSSLCERLLAEALARGGDAADVFAERGTTRALSYEEGRVKSASESRRLGVGIRVVHGERTGYAYCEDLDEATLLATARRAALIADGAPSSASRLKELVGLPSRYRQELPLDAATTAERVAHLKRASDRAFAADPRVQWVSCSIADSDSLVTIASSDGAFVTDRRPMLRFNVNVVARSGDRRESATSGGGGRQGFEYFRRRSPEELAAEAARQALVQFDAIDCPAGAMPVVLAPATSGILIHEAVGHGLEADFNRKGVSNYSGQVGQMVASPLVTVVDDAAIDGDRGAINVDDEGVVPQATTLIENGRLMGYLNDRLSSRLMNVAPTGNGRRESYASVPIPRMRVTYLAAGTDEPADIIASVKRGLYAVNFRGGSVDISKGDFNFNVSEAYLIEDGKVTRPVRGATLIGNGPEVLRRVSRVGHDMRLSDGMWTCGKDGQGCPVGQGLPTTLISEMTVGGRA